MDIFGFSSFLNFNLSQNGTDFFDDFWKVLICAVEFVFISFYRDLKINLENFYKEIRVVLKQLRRKIRGTFYFSARVFGNFPEANCVTALIYAFLVFAVLSK